VETSREILSGNRGPNPRAAAHDIGCRIRGHPGYLADVREVRVRLKRAYKPCSSCSFKGYKEGDELEVIRWTKDYAVVDLDHRHHDVHRAGLVVRAPAARLSSASGPLDAPAVPLGLVEEPLILARPGHSSAWG
jgi:hypothetical protein